MKLIPQKLEGWCYCTVETALSQLPGGSDALIFPDAEVQCVRAVIRRIVFSARQHMPSTLYAIARRPPVCLSVGQTGGSVENG